MHIFVSGATGFIGRALVPHLRHAGHSVVVWARNEARARAALGAEVEIVCADGDDDALAASLEQCDAVVNLAGEAIVGRRWTPARRRVLRASRVGVTERLVRAIESARRRPGVLVSGSAVGFYGDRGSAMLDELAAPADDFLGRLCQDWEAAAQRAEGFGVRV